jgi:hypothetical protein
MITAIIPALVPPPYIFASQGATTFSSLSPLPQVGPLPPLLSESKNVFPALSRLRPQQPKMSTEMVGEQSDDVHQPPGQLSPTRMDDYALPEFRLKRKMNDPEKTPLLLVACGSFSPITYLHLRMFEMAADYVKFSTDFELIGGYLSPVSDAYRKAGLASADHR